MDYTEYFTSLLSMLYLVRNLFIPTNRSEFTIRMHTSIHTIDNSYVKK